MKVHSVATPIEQLEAMRSLVENWDGYGAAIPSATLVEAWHGHFGAGG